MIFKNEIIQKLQNVYEGLDTSLVKDELNIYFPKSLAKEMSVNKHMHIAFGAPVDDIFHIPIMYIESFDLTISDHVKTESRKLVDHFIAGDDIYDLDALDLDYAAIYNADTVVGNRQYYGLFIDSYVLLARLLVKSEYSTLNRAVYGYNILLDYEFGTPDIVIKQFDRSEYIRYGNENNKTWWNIPVVKGQLLNIIKPQVLEYLAENPESENDQIFTTMLGPLAMNRYELTPEAENALRHWYHQLDVDFDI